MISNNSDWQHIYKEEKTVASRNLKKTYQHLYLYIMCLEKIS